MALENQAHVSLNESLIAENKVSSSWSRRAASSTTFYLQHVGNQSCSFAPAYCSHLCSHLPAFPSDFDYKVYLFVVMFVVCSSSPNYGKWDMVSLLYFPFFIFKNAMAVDSQLRALYHFPCFAHRSDCSLVGQDKFLFWANLYVDLFVFIPVFCCPKPAVAPRCSLSFFSSSSFFLFAIDHL